MARLIIQGGRPLSGRHNPSGNKNAALPMLAACVLTDEPLRLENLPLIDDVRTMLALLEAIGVEVRLEDHAVTLCARRIRKTRLPEALCRKVRTSILLAGPLAAREGRVRVFPPGGDMIGRRPLDTHFDGLRQLGISMRQDEACFVFERKVLRGAPILLEEASVTATENILMAAVLAPGETTLGNAACEPHVQDLCLLLTKMGAVITGIGTNRLQVTGVSRLHGAAHRIGPDYIEAASFIAAAALTGGALEVDVRDAPPEPFLVIERAFRKLGVRWTVGDGLLRVAPAQRLRVRNDYGAAIPKIEDGTWPSFPSDLMSVMVVVATQARGTLLFFEKLFESRLYFVDRLIDMGARIIQCDPHRALVAGPARLHGSHLTSPDIRAGMALLLAALCAKGTCTIDNAQSIDRGYESVVERLRALGAQIERQE